jgi:blocked-early-in-transport protein 1
MASNGSGYTAVTHDVEGQNDDRLEGLLGKVKILKDVS